MRPADVALCLIPLPSAAAATRAEGEETMTEIRDVYSRITGKIIADLEQGIRPWHRPWSADHAAGRITRPLRHNGIPYKGINVVMLWSAVVTKRYACPLWLTFKQAIESRSGRRGRGQPRCQFSLRRCFGFRA
jgi:antirestriction protein ArdC